jgi:hypothetical protein
MDKISIPNEDVVAMDAIAPGVAGMRLLLVNVYLVSRTSGEWMLRYDQAVTTRHHVVNKSRCPV